jgi:hypothetical protein
MSTTGRRLPDTRFGELPLPLDDLQPGDIWKYVSKDGTPTSAAALYPKHDMSGNLTDCVWGYVAPTGGIGTLSLHTVREHEDGTVSIRPGDGSSNSILHSGGTTEGWHGYVEHNVWTAC